LEYKANFRSYAFRYTRTYSTQTKLIDDGSHIRGILAQNNKIMALMFGRFVVTVGLYDQFPGEFEKKDKIFVSVYGCASVLLAS